MNNITAMHIDEYFRLEKAEIEKAKIGDIWLYNGV